MEDVIVAGGGVCMLATGCSSPATATTCAPGSFDDSVSRIRALRLAARARELMQEAGARRLPPAPDSSGSCRAPSLTCPKRSTRESRKTQFAGSRFCA
jgi:hypothetical protein